MQCRKERGVWRHNAKYLMAFAFLASWLAGLLERVPEPQDFDSAFTSKFHLGFQFGTPENVP